MRILPLALALMAAISTSATAAPADREVTIDGGKAPLHGSLLTPDGAAGAAVLIVPGSGPTDRNGDSTVPGVTPATYRLLAEGLAAQGIASLRFDKRAIAASAAAAPKEDRLRLSTYVDDAVAWADFLRRQPGVSCVVMLGHSEGSVVAALAAQKTPVCGVISIAGPGRPFGQVLSEQLAARLPEDLNYQAQATLSQLQAGHLVESPPPQLDAIFRPSVQPYLISEINVDPAAELSKVKAPVLIEQGEADTQVKVEDAKALKAKRPDATLVLLPGVNHVLKVGTTDPDSVKATYADPSLPLAPGVLAPIVAFVKAARPAA